MSGTILPTMCQFVGGDPVTQLTALCFPVIPLPSERVFNSATFKCRHIVLTTIINVSHLHLKNPKKKIIFILHLKLWYQEHQWHSARWFS